MSFQANDKHIYELFTKNLYQVPRNQRKYVWDKRNWEEMFEDISLVVDGIYPNHFIGSIVLKDEGREDGLLKYTIIDGQQRITTILALLTSVIYWMKFLGFNNEFDGNKQYISAINDSSKVYPILTSNRTNLIENIIMAILDEDVQIIKSKSIKSFVESKMVSTGEKIIAELFKFYLLKIQKEVEEKNDKKSKLIYLNKLKNAIVDMTYISIISSSAEDSYTIFEILNARGQELDNNELLKNYIMRYIYPTESRDDAREKWEMIEQFVGKEIEKFIKHYTLHKFGQDNSLSDYKLIQRRTKKTEVSDLLNDLVEKSKIYSKFISPKLEDAFLTCNEVEYRVFSFFKKKKYVTMRPIIMSLSNLYNKEKISCQIYCSVLDFLERFYICYNVIGEENSNKISNTIVKYALKIENEYEDGMINDFLVELSKKMPSFDVFKNAFKNIGWSHHPGFYEGEKNKDKVQTILEVHERYKNKGLFNGKMTIEHVLDDAESSQNGIIGNLLPLEENKNHQCIGKKFSEKCDVYSQSNYVVTRNFARIYAEGNFDPSKRTERMAKEFYESILEFSNILNETDLVAA